MGNTNSTLRSPSLQYLHKILLIAALLANTKANAFCFDREQCIQNINGTWLANDSRLLRNSTPREPIIVTCGVETAPYKDSIPRIVLWLVPIFALLANIQYPASSKNGCWALIHILGDPLDYNYSLLCQVETWNQCFLRAQGWRYAESPIAVEQDDEIHHVAVILAAFHWILDHDDEQLGVKQFNNILIEGLSKTQSTTPDSLDFERIIAQKLVVIRSRSPIAAAMSIVIYIGTLIGALVPVIGQSPKPSGSRVSYALIISWIIFTALLSNSVGVISSDDAFRYGIRKYLESCHQSMGQPELDHVDRLVRTSLGSTYYRATLNDFENKKRICFQDRQGQHNPYYLRVLAGLPIFSAVIASIACTSLPPTYLSIRHTVPISLGFLYLVISPLLTVCLRRYPGLTAVRVKNVLVTIFTVGVLVAASCGIFFNNCLGWLPVYPYNMGIALNPEAEFRANSKVWLPLAATLSVLAQFSWFVVFKMVGARGLGAVKLSWRNSAIPGRQGVGDASYKDENNGADRGAFRRAD